MDLQLLLQDQVSKDKAFQTMATMSSAQLISAPSLQAKLGPAGPQSFSSFGRGVLGPPGMFQSKSLFSTLSCFPLSLLSPDCLSFNLPLIRGYILTEIQLSGRACGAFVEPPDAADSYQRHLFVHISQHCPSPGAPPLESVDVRQIYDKFPEKKGGLRELYDRGPPHAFFLVKFWTERAQLEDGRFVYRLLRSPMCEYLVNFLHKLRQLPERYMMNSVLENFTIL
ncbi:hypothetical protein E2I00_012656, partial [Balaenoptera physalus]